MNKHKDINTRQVNAFYMNKLKGTCNTVVQICFSFHKFKIIIIKRVQTKANVGKQALYNFNLIIKYLRIKPVMYSIVHLING